MYAHARRNSSVLLLAIATLVAVLVGSTQHAARAATFNVEVGDNFFEPKEITINVGDTLSWSYTGGSTHNVQASDGSFESPGDVGFIPYQHTFNQPGEFAYFCKYHGGCSGLDCGGQFGLVTVVDPNAEPEPTDEPSQEPTEEPTEEPSQEPTEDPSDEPTDEPTTDASDEPSEDPTNEASDEPTDAASDEATDQPEADASDEPTEAAIDEAADDSEPATDGDDADLDTEAAADSDDDSSSTGVIVLAVLLLIAAAGAVGFRLRASNN